MNRTPIIAAAAAALVAIATAILVAAQVTGSEPETDGSFVLVEPGVFEQPADDVNEDSSGERLPDIALEDPEGRPVDLSIYRGGPMVINLWFSTCVPCQRELVDFAEVHSEYADRVAFVGVNPFDTVESMLRFAEDRGVEYDLLRDTARQLSIELGIVGYPVTLFVDADGGIVHQTGEIDADELRAAIDKYLLDAAT